MFIDINCCINVNKLMHYLFMDNVDNDKDEIALSVKISYTKYNKFLIFDLGVLLWTNI